MKVNYGRKLGLVPLLLGALVLLLAACSDPRRADATPTELVTVELDGFTAQIDMAKLDREALSTQRLRTITYCETNVSYSRVVVPMLALDGWRITPYVDVFWMPKPWSGRLGLFAHGYIAPGSGGAGDFLNLIEGDPVQQESIDLFLCAGNAIGVSSYSAQGYAVQQGIAETHLMNAVFPLIFWRRPTQTYVFGSSMGGLITLALAESFPRSYAGAMPLCGPLGGSLAEFSYIGNTRLLFDEAFPGVLRGTVTNWEPPDPDWVEDVVAAIQNDPAAFRALVNTSLAFAGGLLATMRLPVVQTPATHGAPPTPFDDVLAGNALIHALRYSVLGGGDAMARGGGSPFSNQGVTFEPLNPNVPYVSSTAAISSSPRAVSYYSRYYQPTGSLRVPTLTLHTWVDPDVPTEHEALYRGLVLARTGQAQAPAVLRQYLVLGYLPDDIMQAVGMDPSAVPIALREDGTYGHCNFRPADLVTAFGSLVNRVSTGAWTDLAAVPNSRFTALP